MIAEFIKRLSQLKVVRLSSDGTLTIAGAVSATTSIAVGGGTAITKITAFAAAIDPAAVAAATTAEQLFAVPGITTADKLFINKPTLTAGLGIANVRASAADQIAITFVNATGTAIDAALETYTIIAMRS